MKQKHGIIISGSLGMWTQNGDKKTRTIFACWAFSFFQLFSMFFLIVQEISTFCIYQRIFLMSFLAQNIGGFLCTFKITLFHSCKSLSIQVFTVFFTLENYLNGCNRGCLTRKWSDPNETLLYTKWFKLTLITG